jgi:hypothetical protein
MPAKKTITEVSANLAEKLSKKHGDPAAAIILVGALVDIVQSLVDTNAMMAREVKRR